jgi:hypothetical protein
MINWFSLTMWRENNVVLHVLTDFILLVHELIYTVHKF